MGYIFSDVLARCDLRHAAGCRKVRFATFNTSMNRNKHGQLLKELLSNCSIQARNISAILQHIRPDVVLLNEFDYVANGEAVKAFQELYLSVPQGPALLPLYFKHTFLAPVNTGLPSGIDFDHDGKSAGPQDCFGFGHHPGQYGMVLLSRFPIKNSAARTFQLFKWRDMPGALLPVDPDSGLPWFSQSDLQVLRLSSKSHWDVPVEVPCTAADSRQGGVRPSSSGSDGSGKCQTVHVLLHHPTPPVFDGRERRNMLRNHDEIRLFADYVGCSACAAAAARSSSLPDGEGSDGSTYLYDDRGMKGGLASGSSFVIMGDHNADPNDGESYHHAIRQLLECPCINASYVPASEGGREAGNRRQTDKTPPETKTSSFDLRVDYILPSRDLEVAGGAVWWPVKADPDSQLLEASDHRPVYLDILVPDEDSSTGSSVIS
eukprot:gene12942-13070_t